MENRVIEVLNEEHGKKVIEYWKSKGVDVRERLGSATRERTSPDRYYGVINDRFDNYNMEYIREQNVHVEFIKLPEPLEFPRVMLVWDYNLPQKVRRVVLGYFEKLSQPWLAVTHDNLEDYNNDPKMDNFMWECAEELNNEESQLIELTFEEISAGKGVGVDPKLLRIKK